MRAANRIRRRERKRRVSRGVNALAIQQRGAAQNADADDVDAVVRHEGRIKHAPGQRRCDVGQERICQQEARSSLLRGLPMKNLMESGFLFVLRARRRDHPVRITVSRLSSGQAPETPVRPRRPPAPPRFRPRSGALRPRPLPRPPPGRRGRWRRPPPRASGARPGCCGPGRRCPPRPCG